MKVIFSEEELEEILKTLDNENKGILFSKNVFLKLNELIENTSLSTVQKKLFLKIVGLIVLKKINKNEFSTILELNLDLEDAEAKGLGEKVFKIMELGAIEVRNKKLQELKEKKEEKVEKEEVKEEVYFKKPIKSFEKKDSYREHLE